MKNSLFLLMACSLLSMCVSLPPGSYLEDRVGYSKEGGASAKAVIHIPLGKTQKVNPPGAPFPIYVSR